MAGPVRQPIDLQALEKYIEKHVSEIKTPIDLKQVRITLLVYLAAAVAVTVTTSSFNPASIVTSDILPHKSMLTK